MSAPVSPSRRHFLKVLASSAGALVVGVPLLAAAGEPPLPLALLGDDIYPLGPFVRIDVEGKVLIGASVPDTGTGVATALPRLIAEELDVDWRSVEVVALGLGVAAAGGKPQWLYGSQVGGTGQAVPAAWTALRQAGAAARWLLREAAARRLRVPAERLATDAGSVIAPDGRRIGYGSLAAEAAKIALPARPPALKPPTRWQLIGQGVGDVDARALVTGQAPFALDHQFAESLTAVLARCPWADGTLDSLDQADALAVPGVEKIIVLRPELGQPAGETLFAPAVAVLARDTWAALQGRAHLKLAWKPGPGGAESSHGFEQQAFDSVFGQAAPTTRVRDQGDVEAAAKKAARRVEASYVQPWLAHATGEPMNCLVRLEQDRATLVVPTQAPQRAWQVVSRLTGFAPERIEIRVPRVGGGYGRRLDHDFVAAAVMLAKQVNRPVRLVGTTADDLANDTLRSACVHRLQATLDRKRGIASWWQRMASASALSGRGIPADQLWTSELEAEPLPAALVPNYRSDWYGLASGLPRGPHRGMPHVANAFAVQSFIDEIAHALREDPLTTQLRLLGEPRRLPLADGRTLDTGRLANVLRLVAERIGWKHWLRSINGLGIAVWQVGDACVAHAIEVAVEGETLDIVRAVCAVDVGQVVNPRGLENQVQGATLDALGSALNLAITVRDGVPQQKNWKDYPLARMAQLPHEVEVIVVPGDRPPTGASSLAMPTAAPALANAVFRASAVRVRRLPLMKEWLRLL